MVKAGAVAVVAGVIGVAAGQYLKQPTRPAVVRFPIVLGAEQTFTGLGRRPIAISPDGSHIAYVADRKLFRRSLSELESRVIVDVDTRSGAATNPVFSPDGRSVAYVSDQDKILRRVTLDGGTPVTICPLEAIPLGMSWDASGILFEADGSIMSVSADGGKPETLIGEVRATGCGVRTCCRMGVQVLFTVVDATANTKNISSADYPARIVAQPVRSSEPPRVLIESGMEGRYLPNGYLAYVSRGVLFSRIFDGSRTTGLPVPLVQGVRSEGGIALYAVSATGSLAYVPGSSRHWRRAESGADRSERQSRVPETPWGGVPLSAPLSRRRPTGGRN